jgi:hypothetical protein
MVVFNGIASIHWWGRTEVEPLATKLCVMGVMVRSDDVEKCKRVM